MNQEHVKYEAYVSMLGIDEDDDLITINAQCDYLTDCVIEQNLEPYTDGDGTTHPAMTVYHPNGTKSLILGVRDDLIRAMEKAYAMTNGFISLSNDLDGSLRDLEAKYAPDRLSEANRYLQEQKHDRTAN